MTLQLKAGDWVKLRNGSICGPIAESMAGMFVINHPKWLSLQWTPRGYRYTNCEQSSYDIIAIVDAPETLPEPREMLLASHDGYWNVFDIKSPFKEWAPNDVKFYRCTVTPIELEKP